MEHFFKKIFENKFPEEVTKEIMSNFDKCYICKKFTENKSHFCKKCVEDWENLIYPRFYRNQKKYNM